MQIKSETRTKSTSTEVISTRPAIDVRFESSLQIKDNRILPITKTYEKDGIKVVVGVNQNNELFAEIFIPGDTLRKVVTESEEKADQKITGTVTSYDNKKSGFSGLQIMKFFFKILFAALGFYGVYKYSKLKK